MNETEEPQTTELPCGAHYEIRTARGVMHIYMSGRGHMAEDCEG